MKNMFFPDREARSINDISWEKLKQIGIKGLIFDIDNTLVKHGYPADERSIRVFSTIHELGIKTCLLSNNRESRVQPFAKAVESDYIFKAGKPSTKGYIKAMDMMGTDRHSTVFIGDQIFTDIWGANRAGIETILVDPIDPQEEIQIVLKRIPEKLILGIYHSRHGGK